MTADQVLRRCSSLGSDYWNRLSLPKIRSAIPLRCSSQNSCLASGCLTTSMAIWCSWAGWRFFDPRIPLIGKGDPKCLSLVRRDALSANDTMWHTFGVVYCAVRQLQEFSWELWPRGTFDTLVSLVSDTLERDDFLSCVKYMVRTLRM